MPIEAKTPASRLTIGAATEQVPGRYSCSSYAKPWAAT